MPRAFSSGALSIWSYAVYVAPPVSARIFVIAAVSDVLPWSTCPIVPMLQCGFVRLNFSFAMGDSPYCPLSCLSQCRSGEFRLDFLGGRFRHFRVVVELHGKRRTSLTHGTQRVDVAEHVGKRHHRIDDVGVAAHVLALNLSAP